MLFCGIQAMSLGQTYLFEDFGANEMPPVGWTIENLENQWTINNNNIAGGTAPEAKFTYSNGVFTTRLISPEIDLTGQTTISFQFRHFFDWYTAPAPNIGVATRSNGGYWNSVWEITPNGNIGPQSIFLEISNSDVGSSDFEIAFYMSGNMFNFDNWYIDNIWLFAELDLDASMQQITSPNYFFEATDVSGVIKNLGMSEITSAEIGWQVNDGPVTYTEFTGLSLGFCDTYEFICSGNIDLPIGSYILSVWIESVNGAPDENPLNDLKTLAFYRVSNNVERIPCVELFASSTSFQSAYLNWQFNPWCEDHADSIRLLKYQMNWPGSGDPYYTAEGGIRRDYYGVNAVPAIFFNGTYFGFLFNGVQPAFENAILQPGFMSIVSSHELEGTEMTVSASVLPYADFTNFRVQIVVFENITTQNATSNGETEFHHVMMKMIPGANGTSVDMSDRQPQTFTETVDLEGTNVEEWDDLGVIVFVQDNSSKEIYQSEYSVQDGVFADDATLVSITVDGEPLDGFSPDIFSYDYPILPGTVEVPMVEAVITDPNGHMITVPANELPGSTAIDVFAEDLATHNTYSVNFGMATGIDAEPTIAVKIYPNPTNGRVNINGVENAKVKVYKTSGAVVYSNDKFTTGTVDLSNFNEGIYCMSIMIDNKTVLNKKISLVK